MPYAEGELTLSSAAHVSYHCAHGRALTRLQPAYTVVGRQWVVAMYTVVRESRRVPEKCCMQKTIRPFRFRAAHCRTHGRAVWLRHIAHTAAETQ